jgi:hypothetical protein
MQALFFICAQIRIYFLSTQHFNNIVSHTYNNYIHHLLIVYLFIFVWYQWCFRHVLVTILDIVLVTVFLSYEKDEDSQFLLHALQSAVLSLERWTNIHRHLLILQAISRYCWYCASSIIIYCKIIIFLLVWASLNKEQVCNSHVMLVQGCQPYAIAPCEHHVNGTRPACEEGGHTPKCQKKCEQNYKLEYKKDLNFGMYKLQYSTGAH